jgi:hypothetical protein
VFFFYLIDSFQYLFLCIILILLNMWNWLKLTIYTNSFCWIDFSV